MAATNQRQVTTASRDSHWSWTLAGSLAIAGAGYLAWALEPGLGVLAASLCAAPLLWRARRAALDQKLVLTYITAIEAGEFTQAPTDLCDDSKRLVALIENQSRLRKAHADVLMSSARALGELATQAEDCGQTVQSLHMQGPSPHRQVLNCLQDAPSLIGQLSRHLSEQREAAESGQAAAFELNATHTAVGENIHELAESVDETAASIEEMTYSIKEVARNIEDLSLAAEQTATSMNQMDSSIGEVESNVQVTAQLADEVSRDAGKGAEAVERTLDGIDKIRVTVNGTAKVIGNLGLRIEEIGKILGVIEEVAEQTNLLALNAAIIAAQAGEHGRGFAVVAEEIKDLSDKTGASTKEIATLVRSIQEESNKAVAAITTGERNVAEGVDLSREAENALAKIIKSSAKSTQRFKTIAAATAEQARGSKVVADAVERIARSVQQVAAATAEQARGSEQLMRSAERIKGITSQVEKTIGEQGLGNQQIIRFIEQVNEHMLVLGTVEHALHEIMSQATRLGTELPETAIDTTTLERIRELAPLLRKHADRLVSQGSEQTSTVTM